MRIIRYLGLLFIILLLQGCGRNSNTFQGYVEGDYVYIASADSGNLTQLLVHRGDRVVAGQPLFVLDPEPESSRYQQARQQLTQANQVLLDQEKGQRDTVIASWTAQLAEAQAKAEFAKQTVVRYRELRAKAAIDQATVDQAIANDKQAAQKVQEISANLAEAKLGARENQIAAQKATVAAAEASVKQAEWALLQKSVRAQTNATVFDTLYELGEFTTAGRPIVVLLPPGNIKFIFFVPEKVLGKIKVGDVVNVDCDNCKKHYIAHINYISPSAEYTPPVIFSKENRNKLIYRIEAHPKPEEATQFKPGQPVDVKIISQ